LLVIRLQMGNDLEFLKQKMPYFINNTLPQRVKWLPGLKQREWQSSVAPTNC
jgi:hypothetical protein